MFANPMMLPFMFYRRWLERLMVTWAPTKSPDPGFRILTPPQGGAGQETMKQIAEVPNGSVRRSRYISARIQKARRANARAKS